MWLVALCVGGCGRGGGWFVVLWRLVRGIASVIRASQVAPLRLRAVGLQFFVGRFVALPVGAPFMTPGAGTAHVVGRVACRRMRAGRRLVRGIASVIRASRVAPLRLHWLIVVLWRLSGRHKWRPYVCGRLNAVSRRSFGRHKWRPYVCGWLNVVSRRSSGRHKWRPYVCGRLIVVSRRSSGRHKWRPYVCGWLIVVSRVVVGGVTRGCRGKGMGMKKEAGLTLLCLSGFLWLRRLDSNERPPGYEPGELPTAPLRDVFLNSSAKVRLLEISSKFFADFFPFFEKCGVCGAVTGLSVWGVR